MLNHCKVISARIKDIKTLCEYDVNHSESFYINDWIEGNTIMRKYTNMLLRQKNI